MRGAYSSEKQSLCEYARCCDDVWTRFAGQEREMLPGVGLLLCEDVMSIRMGQRLLFSCLPQAVMVAICISRAEDKQVHSYMNVVMAVPCVCAFKVLPGPVAKRARTSVG